MKTLYGIKSLWDKELARMVASIERRMRQIDGDRIPVLGIQGDDIRDKQGMEASRTRDGLMDSSYLKSICSLKFGGWAQLDTKTLLGVLPSNEIPNELYKCLTTLCLFSSPSLHVYVSCECAFVGRDVGGAGNGEEMLSGRKGGDLFFPEVPGLSLTLTGLVATNMSPSSLITICSAQTCYFFFF